MALRLVITLAALVFVGEAQSSEIYRWVDSAGRVHFGDRPPEGEGDAVELDTSPRGVDLAPATDGLRSTAAPPTLGAEATASSSEPSTAPPTQERLRCYSSAESALGRRGALLTGEVAIPLLTEAEQARIVTLLEAILGNWKAEVTETQCLGSPAQPETKELHEDAQPQIVWPFRGSWQLEATLEGSETREVTARTLWLQVADGKLFFGTSETTQTTQARSRVVPLSVGHDHLSWARWYRQPSAAGATITRTEVRDLRAGKGSVRLIEVFYTQGQLNSRRIWELVR